MIAEQKLMARMEALITEGEDLLKTAKQHTYDTFVDRPRAIEWNTQVQHTVKLALGEASMHFQQFSELRGSDSNYSRASGSLAILRAALRDLSEGFVSLPRLVAAEVFDSLLEQAEELHTKGYRDAAAVIVGGVLEEHLRAMCGSRGVDLEHPSGKRKTIDNTLNADLAKAGAYNKHKQKQITAWADLRNKAAHAEYSEYSADDVRAFIDGVRSFCADFS